MIITNEDCMKLMARYPNKHFDLAIVDPPYGINVRLPVSSDNKKWDKKAPDKKYFDELFRVSKRQIIWGGNYFSDKLPPCRGFVIWRKTTANIKMSYSMCEFAWTSFDCPSKYFECSPPKTAGWYQGEKRIHSTQKPVALYDFLLAQFAKPRWSILDTHLGSGSIAIACKEHGFDLTASEIDKEYYEKAMERINNYVPQSALFSAEEIFTQQDLFEEYI